jgi:hypothetical protein
MNENEVYWAAGFFDGEGNIRWERVDHYYDTVYERAVIKISQVNREPLERFQKAVDGGNINGPYARKGRDHSPYYEWRTSKYSEVKRIAELLKEYVSSIKREQIINVIDKMDAWKEKARVYKERKGSGARSS